MLSKEGAEDTLANIYCKIRFLCVNDIEVVENLCQHCGVCRENVLKQRDRAEVG